MYFVSIYLQNDNQLTSVLRRYFWKMCLICWCRPSRKQQYSNVALKLSTSSKFFLVREELWFIHNLLMLLWFAAAAADAGATQTVCEFVNIRTVDALRAMRRWFDDLFRFVSSFDVVTLHREYNRYSFVSVIAREKWLHVLVLSDFCLYVVQVVLN